MRQNSLQADEIIQFLEKNPSFFLEHESVLRSLQLPHPRTAKLISLAERQTLLLRKHNQQLEKQISQFLHNARENEEISKALLNWTCDLLAFNGNHQDVCQRLCYSLKEKYELQNVQLRLWWPNHAFQASDCPANTKQWVHALSEPYTGPTANVEIAQWFSSPVSSMAVIPLFAWGSQECVGALALGSDDSKRFTYNIGTDFLKAMGQIFMAMLARYYEQKQQTA